MTSLPTDLRCSRASRDDDEPMAGTAPTETSYLLVEYAGPWGRRAVAESRLPEEVRGHLAGLADVRVQLIRRYGGVQGPGVRVFMATLDPTDLERPRVATTVLDDVRDLPGLDLTALTPYADLLWLVCTNGRRDRCCAEAGRPIAAALSGRWPEGTWETTHLGGHRFAGTLLALPSGITLGRLDAESAVEACRRLEAGRVPVAHTRGRAGLSGVVQVAELYLRTELGLDHVDDVTVVWVDGGTVRLAAGAESYEVRVETTPGAPRRQSCADLATKAGPVYEVCSWVRVPT